MEDEKKKKRNKKKKNKKNKPNEDCVEEATSADQNNVRNGHIAPEGGEPDAMALNQGEVDVAGDEKINLEPIKALAEDKINESLVRTHSYMQKEAALNETIKHLQEEKESHLQRQTFLEGTILSLKEEKDLHLQKSAKFEEQLMHFENENKILVEKEIDLEGQIKQLLEERSTLALKGTRLEEKLTQVERERESWLVKENESKETISSLNAEIARLNGQVVELEKSCSLIAKQNQQLMEDVSGLELQLQNHERNIPSAHPDDELSKGTCEQEDLKSQIEAANFLVERLVAENAELVEKVNELCTELNQPNMSRKLSSAAGSESLEEIVDSNRVAVPDSLSTETISVIVDKTESLEDIPINDDIIIGDSKVKTPEPASMNSNSLEPNSGEIVQDLLDDNEERKMEAQVIERDDEDSVRLMDAPLIGAPFRLVSFFARYVSGADLVENRSLLTRY